jgi:hypothetical protein
MDCFAPLAMTKPDATASYNHSAAVVSGALAPAPYFWSM